MEPIDLADFAGALQPKTATASDAPSDGHNHLLTVSRAFAALGRGDVDEFLKTMHPDVSLEIFAPPEFPWIRRAQGLHELRRAIEYNFATLSDQRPEVVSSLVQGDSLVLTGRERGRLTTSNRPYDVHFVYEFTFRDGKIFHVREVAASSDTSTSTSSASESDG
jgi:uncharacterized protein